jgi:hypothetical protein
MSTTDQNSRRPRSRLAVALDCRSGLFLLLGLVTAGLVIAVAFLALFFSVASKKAPPGFSVSIMLKSAAADSLVSMLKGTISNTPSLITYAERNVRTNVDWWEGLRRLCPNIWVNTNYGAWGNVDQMATLLVAECTENGKPCFVACSATHIGRNYPPKLLDGPPTQGFHRICLDTNRVEFSAR